MLRPVDILMFAFYLVLAALAVAADLHDPVWFVALGLSVVCAALWLVARLQLGAAFSVRPEARQLVETGLYSRLRHPIYVFGTAAFLLVLAGAARLAGAGHLGDPHPRPDRPGAPRGARAGGGVRGRVRGVPRRHLVLRSGGPAGDYLSPTQ